MHGKRFTIVTDHQPLNYILNCKDPTGKITRWALLLQSYYYDVEYRPGRQNGSADALSRRTYEGDFSNEGDIFLCSIADQPNKTLEGCSLENDISDNNVLVDMSGDHEDNKTVNQEDDETNGPQLEEEHFFFHNKITQEKEELKCLQLSDKELSHKILYLKDQTIPDDKKEGIKLLADINSYILDENDILYHIYEPSKKTTEGIYKQLVIPPKFRDDIIYWAHNHATAGHFGFVKTLDKLRKRYYWPLMYSDVEHWIRGCTHCSQRKGNRSKYKAPLHPIPATEPWDQVACDVIGPFPATLSGNKYIVVFQDRLTAWPEAFASSNKDAVIIAQLLLDNIILRYGAPHTFLTDRGTNFLSKLINELCKMVNTKKINTSPYHPECDGMVERFNGTLVKTLSMYVSDHQKDWDVHINAALFAYRTSVNSSRGESPYFLLFGREPRLPPDITFYTPKEVPHTVIEYRNLLATRIKLAHELARSNLQKAQLQNKLYYDRNAKEPTFKEGEKVWIHNKERKQGLSPKLQTKWQGPYQIIEKVSPVNFKVKLVDGSKAPFVVHSNRLKKFHEPPPKPNDSTDSSDSKDDASDNTINQYGNQDNQPTAVEKARTSEIEANQPEGRSYFTDKKTPNNITSPKPPNKKSKQNKTSFSDESPLVTDQDITDDNDNDIYLVEAIRNHRTRKGKREFLIKWKDYEETENTWEPENNLDPNLVKTYLCNHTPHNLSNIPLNPMIMTFVQHSKRTRSYNLLALMMQIFFFVPIFILNVRAIGLGPIYDCTTTTPLGIYDYPTIRNCKHKMNQEEYQVKTYSAEVFRYSPKVSKFPIYLCSHFEITLTCDHRNIFLSSKRLRQEKEIKVPTEECLAMVWNQILNTQLTRKREPTKEENVKHVFEQIISPNKKTPISSEILDVKQPKIYKIEEGLWQSYVLEKYDCNLFRKTTTIKQLYEVQQFKAQLIGNATIIEQHLTDSECPSKINQLYDAGICNMNRSMKAIVWRNPNHDYNEMQSLGTHQVQRSGEYFLIPSLQVGGAIQQTMGIKEETIQLDNGLVLRNTKNHPNIFHLLTEAIKEYAKTVSDTVVAPLLEAHFIQTMIYQKQMMIQEWERLCFIQQEMTKLQHWMISTFPNTASKWIHPDAGVLVHTVGDALQLEQCKKISNYRIHLNRKINDTCYHDFPISIPSDNTTRFLKIFDRQVIKTSSITLCKNRLL